MLVERCESLEKELQLSNQRLQEACNVGGLPIMQKQLTTMAGKRDAALKRVQELLAEGRTLEAQHQELKVQLVTTTTEYESRLWEASLELESKQKQYEREAEFAQAQKSEGERLTNDLKEARGDLKTQKGELDALRAQTPPVHTMAQYPAVPPRQPYGSPMQMGTMLQGHYSPTVVPFPGVANLTASPGQVSTLAGFSYGTTVQSPQVQGSPQPQGSQVLLRPATFVPPGPQQALANRCRARPRTPWCCRLARLGENPNEPVAGPGVAFRPGNTPLSPLGELD